MQLTRERQIGTDTLPETTQCTITSIRLLLFLLILSQRGNALKVPSPLFWGDDKVLMNEIDSVTLDWFVEPGYTTISWVRCYQGNGQDKQHHFFSYDFNSGRQFLGGPLKGRTSICPFKYRDDAPFAIRILLHGPTKSDTGWFTCEIDVGGSDPVEAKLMLRVYVEDTSEKWILSHSVSTSVTQPGNMTENRELETFHKCQTSAQLTSLEIGLICFILSGLCICVIPFVFVWKRQSGKKYSSVPGRAENLGMDC